MDISSFIIILTVGLAGGFFNTFIGAGSLLSIPVLILLGLPPHTSVATNRLGVIGSDIAGWYGFHVKKMIDYRAGIILAVPTLIGAIIGANLVLEVDEARLKKIIGFITFVILIFIMIRPKMGIEHIKTDLKNYHYINAVIIGFIVGIYGGFYGAGAGTLLIYILILFFGATFMESAGTHALANLCFSATAASIFAYKGMINYAWVVPLFIGSFIGSYMSAYYSDKIGNIWIKRLFFVVVIVVVLKLLI